MPVSANPSNGPFSRFLVGDGAFFKQDDYIASTKRDFAVRGPLPPVYTWNTEKGTESKTRRVAKLILSIVVFPIAIYKIGHVITAYCGVLVAATYNLDAVKGVRTRVSLEGDWKYRRITVEVDGINIDAALFGKESTLENGRWILGTKGNGEIYEETLTHGDYLKRVAQAANANVLVFNYPGVGASGWLPNRTAAAKAYRAMLNFLEDQENGIGAKEIIGFGHSIGAAVQAEGTLGHQFKPEVKYVFIKSRTFSVLRSTVNDLTCRLFGLLVAIFGWNMRTDLSSRLLPVPEVILQTADVVDAQVLENMSKVLGDEIISREASLAKALYGNTETYNNKLLVGMPELHNNGIRGETAKLIATLINQRLATPQAV